MKQLTQRINWSIPEDQHHLMILDKQGPKERMKIFASSAAFMFSNKGADKPLEPPLEVKSHLYQTVQCADWICPLLSQISAYKYDLEFDEFKWSINYFGTRLARLSSPQSKIRAASTEASKGIYPNHLASFKKCYLKSALPMTPKDLPRLRARFTS